MFSGSLQNFIDTAALGERCTIISAPESPIEISSIGVGKIKGELRLQALQVLTLQNSMKVGSGVSTTLKLPGKSASFLVAADSTQQIQVQWGE